MSCEDIRNLALLAACGEAGEAEAATVREHAAKCRACAEEIRALNEGLELLKHVPRESPSSEARSALGSLLLREAPRPALRSVRGWAIAAAALMAVTATALAWKLGAWGVTKPADVARGNGKESVEPAPVATKDPQKTRKPVDTLSTWTLLANDDIDDFADAVKELRGGSTTSSVKPDPGAVWFRQDTAAVDALYDGLDEITASPDKF
ncbi:MAG: hypothetical protein FD180_4253 [Planctomycetota bacterium]|nr:MAG: hypothetical protein FD180_4253 [Planctomycetota bacterium]